jgi:hypothetical protein
VRGNGESSEPVVDFKIRAIGGNKPRFVNRRGRVCLPARIELPAGVQA